MRFPSLPRVYENSTIRNPKSLKSAINNQQSQSAIDNQKIRNHQAAVRNLQASLAQEVLQAAPAPLVHRREHRAEAVERHARRQSDAASHLHISPKCAGAQTAS